MEPAFLIGGGQRCGTTSLYRILDEHPEIYLAKPVQPEPKFFLEDPRSPRNRQWYLDRWFADCGAAKIAGEKSTSYLETPGTAWRIHAMFPRMKVIFILRHPVERAVSNYRYSRRNGLETVSLDEALRTQDQRVRQHHFPGVSAHPLAYLDRGCYADFLAQYLEIFDPEALHVLLHSDLRDRPAQTCESLFEFLGVDRTVRPAAMDLRHNEAPLDNVSLSRETVDLMLKRFREPNARLASLLGRNLSAWNRAPESVVSLVS